MVVLVLKTSTIHLNILIWATLRESIAEINLILKIKVNAEINHIRGSIYEIAHTIKRCKCISIDKSYKSFPDIRRERDPPKIISHLS